MQRRNFLAVLTTTIATITGLPSVLATKKPAAATVPFTITDLGINGPVRTIDVRDGIQRTYVGGTLVGKRSVPPARQEVSHKKGRSKNSWRHTFYDGEVEKSLVVYESDFG